MNMPSGLERNHWAFFVVTSVAVLFSTLVFFYVIRFLRKKSLL